MKPVSYVSAQILLALIGTAGITANYDCKFSIPGSWSKGNFDGSHAIIGYQVGDFEFAVRPVTVASADDPPQNIAGFSITVTGKGLKTIAVAPMGTSVVGLVNETFGVTASCRIK